MPVNILTGRKDYIRLNARDGESISISNAAIGSDTTESLKNAVGTCVISLMCKTCFNNNNVYEQIHYCTVVTS